MDYAALNGLLPFVRLLVEQYAIGVNEPFGDSPDYTPILKAAQNGHLETVRWLLDHGAQINFEYDGRQRCEALMRAAGCGHIVGRDLLDVVKLLVERGANIHVTDSNGASAVSIAEISGHFAVRNYLLSVGAKDPREMEVPDFAAAHKILIGEKTAERGPLADWRLQIAGEPEVTIHLIPVNEKCDHQTLFTVGLSDKNLPMREFRHAYHELRVMLPAEWPLTEAVFNDPQQKWPVEWLKRIVEELRSGDYWPEEPMLFMNGDPPEPLAPNTKLSGWLCLRSMRGDGVDLPDHRCVEWHDLYAIYAEEAELRGSTARNRWQCASRNAARCFMSTSTAQTWLCNRKGGEATSEFRAA